MIYNRLEMVSLEQQIKLLHQSLIEKFQDLKAENEKIKVRLENIENKLSQQTPSNTEIKIIQENVVEQQKLSQSNENSIPLKKQKQPNVQKTRPKKETPTKSKTKTNQSKEKVATKQNADDDEDFGDDVDFGKITSANIGELPDASDNDDDTVVDITDDGVRHDVNIKTMPCKIFEGFSFRPLTAWRNKDGNYEISKEVIEFTTNNVSFIIRLFSSLHRY